MLNNKHLFAQVEIKIIIIYRKYEKLTKYPYIYYI